MSDDRYDRIYGFIWHFKGKPYPDFDIHLLGMSQKMCRFRGSTEEEAKNGLMAFARKFGANALLDVYFNVSRNAAGGVEFACFGRPALYARPNPDGPHLESQLRAGFSQPYACAIPKYVEYPSNDPGISAEAYRSNLISAASVYLITLLIMGPFRTLVSSVLVLLLTAAYRCVRNLFRQSQLFRRIRRNF